MFQVVWVHVLMEIILRVVIAWEITSGSPIVPAKRAAVEFVDDISIKPIIGSPNWLGYLPWIR